MAGEYAETGDCVIEDRVQAILSSGRTAIAQAMPESSKLQTARTRPHDVKILTLSFEYPPLGGGGSKVVQGLSAELIGMGHEVEVVTMSYRGLPRTEEMDGVRIHRVRCLRSSVDVSNPVELASYMLGALPTVLRLGKNGSFDILHCHFIMPDGLVGLLASRRLGIPLIVTAHGSDVPGYNPDRFKFLHKLIAPAWRSAVRSMDRIVCPSRFLENLIREHEPSADTVVIPNGLHLDKFDASRERKRSILIVTRMLKRKGVQDVLHALSGTDTGFEINIVGTGPYLDELKSLAGTLDVDVRFHGWLDNDSAELKELFETAAIFVFPSHAENFPLVLLEAMAAGNAIVTTNQTGCQEVVGDAAICVTPEDHAAIREAVVSLATDTNLRKQKGKEARERLEKEFSWPAVSRRYLASFEDLIHAQQSAGA